MSIKQTDLIAELAKRTSLTRVQVLDVYQAYRDLMVEQLTQEGNFPIHHIGRLRVKQRVERLGRNPRTGEPITIPARQVVTFKASKGMTEHLNRQD